MVTGMEVVLEVVRMPVNERNPTMVPTLYADARATDLTIFFFLAAMWLDYPAHANGKTPSTCRRRRHIIFSACFFNGWAIIRPSGP